MGAVLVLEGHLRRYRHTWKGTAVSSFVTPALFLTAMGLGLGSLVDRGPGGDLQIPYLTFLATGLLAAGAMQTAAGDSTWPVMGALKWERTYHAALATPLVTRHLLLGHLLWVVLRVASVSVAFVIVARLFGAMPLWGGLLAVTWVVLTGLAFAAPILAWIVRLENHTALAAMFRFGIMPMFLFSGTFFPVSQLPGWAQPVVVAIPLWHGAELVRMTALGLTPALSPTVHVAVLAGLTVVGALLAHRGYESRLVR